MTLDPIKYTCLCCISIVIVFTGLAAATFISESKISIAIFLNFSSVLQCRTFEFFQNVDFWFV